ncbi:MBL fold metallo-hydrolase [bacterium LRH843]|nr:MBL fold metallo-hydrolase [bacterium LRH843]
MNWTQIPLGPLQTNAYVIWNKKKEAIIVDPGGNAKEFTTWLQQNELNPLAIILTHAHFDHIGAVHDVRNTFHAPVYIHEKEQDWLIDPMKNRSAIYGEAITTNQADHIISKDGLLSIGPFSFYVYETPGHSPGSVSYFLEEEAIVFSGDVLFSGGVGRTDLPGGNQQQLLESIHQKLLELPENTIVACGHGQTTTIGQEMDGNPYLSGF